MFNILNMLTIGMFKAWIPLKKKKHVFNNTFYCD